MVVPLDLTAPVAAVYQVSKVSRKEFHPFYQETMNDSSRFQEKARLVRSLIPALVESVDCQGGGKESGKKNTDCRD